MEEFIPEKRLEYNPFIPLEMTDEYAEIQTKPGPHSTFSPWPASAPPHNIFPLLGYRGSGDTPTNPVIYEEDPKKKGMRFCAMLSIRQKGGTVTELPEGLEVAGADSVTLYLAAPA